MFYKIKKNLKKNKKKINNVKTSIPKIDIFKTTPN